MTDDPTLRAFVAGRAYGMGRALTDEEAAAVEVEATTIAATIDADLEAWRARHPDWLQHEAAMMAAARRLPPGDLDVDEYLDVLLLLARRHATDDDERTTH